MKAIMRVSLVMFAVILAASATASAVFEKSFIGLTYSTVSMTTSETITVLDGIYRHHSNDKKIVEHRLKKSELSILSHLVGQLDLSMIDEVEVPSKRHRFDGAKLTTIKVQIGQKLYISVPFDHDNPPHQLRPLADQLSSMHP